MVRCMRCGASVEGYAQMCDNCAAQKRDADLASMQQAVETSTMGCPWCGATMLRSAQRCSSCFRDWADYRAPVVGMSGVQRGDFWVRLVAAIIDGLILVVPYTVFLLIFGKSMHLVTVTSRNDGGVTADVNLTSPGVLLLVAVGIAYNVWFWTQKGATPGKMAMGLKVVDGNGKLLTPLHALGRHFSYFISNITFFIGYLMIFGEEHLGLHDRVSGSQVVFANTLPKKQPATEMQPAVQ